MKHKKLYEQEIDKFNGMRVTLEDQAMALESAALNVEVFKTMKAANEAMKVKGFLADLTNLRS
jgi:hypothetical protein